MSGHGFHVHGAHNHELEHAGAHAGKDAFAGRIAVTSAILAELGAALATGEGVEQYRKEVERYKGEKSEIQQKAEALEAESKEWDDRSAESMHLHHRWAQATTLLQVAIALSAIALLTRRT